MKIIYVTDVLCIWCYGISDEINKLHDHFKDQLDFEVIPAGMWVGNNVKELDSKLATYIRNSSAQVANITGAEYGEGFDKMLNQKGLILDSYKGSKAINTAKVLTKAQPLPYLKAIQKAFFVNGVDLNADETYFEIAKQLGMDKAKYQELYNSEQLTNMSEERFKEVKKLGVSSFPSVLGLHKGKLYMLSPGYSKFESIKTKIESVLNNRNTLF